MATRVRRQGPEWLGRPTATNPAILRCDRPVHPADPVSVHVTDPEGPTTTADQRAELARLLSGGRLNSYTDAVAAAADDTFDALDLYVYNMALAGALLGPLHVLEIITRNAIHELLVARTGRRDWWADASVSSLLRPWGRDQLAVAGDKVRRTRGRSRSPVSPDDVVAATEFGFWTDLLRPSYETTLWQDPVRHAFPHSRRSRQQLYQALQSHRRLRNRVTHHEPLHLRDASREYEGIIQFIGYVSRPVARWVADRSRLGEVVAGRPGSTRTPVCRF
jgi:hypothetical protein